MPSLPQFIDSIRSRLAPLNGKSKEFDAFVGKLHVRRDMGRHQYADTSKTRPARFLAQEIEQELLDVPSWTFDLFSCPQPLTEEDKAAWLNLCADSVRLWFRFKQLEEKLPPPPGFHCHVGDKPSWRSDSTGDSA